MSRLGRMGRTAAAFLGVVLLAAGWLTPPALGAGPDQAEVVLVFDFSSSILDDVATRSQFGAALERMADRVEETQRDLLKGDTRVSIVQFASRAADTEGCTEMELLGSQSTVRRFANCLRSVAASYRAGGDPALARRIGDDTNYVAAMEQAATHLPPDAIRPTMILFSDGRHDVAGVPVGEVPLARDRLFGDRSPFALLPVGMGIDPAARAQLEAGLAGLRTTRDMPACSTGATFEWPEVVFDSPEDAGNAVAVALQNATCTFTAAPTASPPPPPAAAVRGIRLQPLDGRIEVTWSAPPPAAGPIVDYKVRCTPAGGAPIESTEGVSLERSAVVEGLTNGTEYTCEVATVGESSEGEWTAAAASAIPSDRPPAPGKPSVEALDGAIRVTVPPADASAASSLHYECSADNGATWPGTADVTEVAETGQTAAQVGGLSNGVAYVCRAFAANDSGVSDASPLSDAVLPCASLLECNGLSTPVVAAVVGVLLGALLIGLYFLLRGRAGGYTVAVVDVVHTANLGGGSSLGITFERRGRDVDGIIAAKGRKADIRIQKIRGDRFKVRDRTGTKVAESGEPIVIVDATGTRHELVLRAFEGKAASTASVRR
jgi:hypothetical protein